VDKLCDDPSGITRVALVPGGNTTVACREPISSTETLPRATCVVVLALEIKETRPS